ncbi:MAG: glycosyltransferase family 2 protein [Acidobacteria bacterium]|nr:glycosyltransferase family 2 protein [Acidobacteriota bacterium]
MLTATFNAAGFIETTLASALRQTFDDFELVIIDDGSSDGTVEVVARLMAADARIRLIRQMNRGPSATRNRAILESRGELIAFLDHDDLWLPDKLARQVALIDAPRGGRGVVLLGRDRCEAPMPGLAPWRRRQRRRGRRDDRVGHGLWRQRGAHAS